MKTLLFFLLFTCYVFAQNTQITILHTGDSHSHLDAFGPKNASGNGTIGGIGKAATIIGTVKATEPNVLLLHSGDFSVGDFFFNKYFGVPEIQIMKQLGYDAMTVGNHEFDLGATTLYSVLQESFQGGNFPVLSANLDLTAFPQLGSYVSPYVIKDISGVKVGIFGLTIPSPLNNPYPVIIQENIPEITYATVNAMQSEGANVVIMLSHLGWSIDSSLAVNIPGLNFIVGGHDHYVFSQPKSLYNPAGFQTYVVQAGENYEYVGKLNFTYANGVSTFNSYSLLPVDAGVEPVPEIQGVIDYLKQGIVGTYGDVYGTIIGYAHNDIGRTSNVNNPHYKDSPIGNLITDSYRKKTNSEIAITANGLISQKIYEGPINCSDIFHTVAYGFDTTTGLGFNLLNMTISGMELIKGLEVGLSQLGVTEDYFLQVSGMEFRYLPGNPVGSRVILTSVKVNSKPINFAKNYSLTINEGLYGILLMTGVVVENVTPTGIPEFTALKDYIASLGNVSYRSEGRIKEKAKESEKDGPESVKSSTGINTYKLFDNYPNPFNPVTNIKYQIPKDSRVSIIIYDITGREIKSLVNEVKSAGSYIVSFNAASLSSGVYFYRMMAGDFVQTKRMLLVK